MQEAAPELKRIEKKYYSNCEQREYSFDYHGIKSALCGNKVSKNGMIDFVPKRIMVIQME